MLERIYTNLKFLEKNERGRKMSEYGIIINLGRMRFNQSNKNQIQPMCLNRLNTRDCDESYLKYNLNKY